MIPDRFKRDGARSSLNQWGQYLGLGLELALYLLLFIFLGRYLDQRWDTEPWLTITGAVIGFLAGFYTLYKTLIRLSGGKHDKDERDSR